MKQTYAVCLNAMKACSLMFGRLGKQDYELLITSELWKDLTAVAEAQSEGRFCEEFGRIATPPDADTHKMTQDNLLTAGMPLAAPPIESLYVPCKKDCEGGEFRTGNGLYLGDSALHLLAVYEDLDIELPHAFSSTPDHLSLILDLVVLLAGEGQCAAARQISADHLAFLPTYHAFLSAKAAEVPKVKAFSESKQQAIGEGILFFRALVALLIEVTTKELGEGEVLVP